MTYLFDVPAYFILLRETLEVTIVIAVLLGFIDKLIPEENSLLKKKLLKQILIGTVAGLGVSILLGVVFIIIFYSIARNLWKDSGAAWEGTFSLIATIVITSIALSMIQVQQWRIKWEGRLKHATEQYLKRHERGNKWALVLLPFSVICRETVESIVFIAGVGLDKPTSGFPIPIIMGIMSGFAIGYLIYKGSNILPVTLFFAITTTLLLFIAAGFFSSSIHELQESTGSYEYVLWEFNCCDPKTNQFWGIMKTLFGWRSKVTLGTTVGYFVYWFVIVLLVTFIWYKGKRDNVRTGRESGNNNPSLNGTSFNEKDATMA
ncbi:17736_t:CDS:2 [Funneliformis geosporum]|uniref:8683_t:CDS:1 n=1 Tax=Funneliformis geosporum TaxID=1117311 RepID=A0A9W4WJL6_9GLOM|nr:17736_t:CDS:2 [Funneliformis geosporum]CAI2166544.1 8683_t:CDS:2 [Funneliformis geosporum]